MEVYSIHTKTMMIAPWSSSLVFFGPKHLLLPSYAASFHFFWFLLGFLFFCLHKTAGWFVLSCLDLHQLNSGVSMYVLVDVMRFSVLLPSWHCLPPYSCCHFLKIFLYLVSFFCFFIASRLLRWTVMIFSDHFLIMVGGSSWQTNFLCIHGRIKYLDRIQN